MKNVIRLFVVAFCFVLAQVPMASAQKTVDSAAASVAATATAFEKYRKQKEAAWQEYSQAKLRAFGDYHRFEQEQLKVLRATDYKSYVAMIDAEKLNDYKAEREVQKAPAVALYKKLTTSRYNSYKDEEHAAYERYKEADRVAYEKYKTTRTATSTVGGDEIRDHRLK
jgi:hypothetical protein